MRLLIVEDDADTAMALSAALRRIDADYEIVHAPSLRDAIRHVDAGRCFDSALVDLGLPDASQLQAPMRLCAGDPNLVVVVLTGDSDAKIAPDIIRVGAQDYLLKGEATPVMIDRVLRCAVERHQRELRLRGAAIHDDLTGLLNRRGGSLALSAAIRSATGRKASSCAMLLVDLDGFKSVNDTLGHAAGDILLQQCARRIAGCLRPSDKVARIGGDEFTVMIEKISSHDVAATVAAKLVAIFRRPFRIRSQALHISASVGVAVYPDDADSAGTLASHADQAMYEAKRRGKNQYFTYRQMVATAMVGTTRPVSMPPAARPASNNKAASFFNRRLSWPSTAR